MRLILGPSGLARFGAARLPCAIGRGGMRRDKREGDGATPVGVWRIEHALYRADRMARPRTALPVSAIGPRDGWSDDPEDPFYNSAVRLPHGFSHERLRRGDGLYDLIAVLDHNRHPATPGAGSAIFLHCWRGPRRPTEGCVAFRRTTLVALLEAWRPARDRVVVIA